MQKMEPLQDLVHDDYGVHQYNTKHAHIHKAGKCESGRSRHMTCCTWAEFLFLGGGEFDPDKLVTSTMKGSITSKLS